jgi:hypothetical protein
LENIYNKSVQFCSTNGYDISFFQEEIPERL